MIATWMLYTVAVSLLLCAGAYAAEHAAMRAVGAQTRIVWVATIVGAFVLSGRALSNGHHDVLLTLWLAASAIATAYLAALLARRHRLERRLQPAIVNARSVLLSDDMGPAVLGVFRSRIVLPRWVLSLSRAERDVILAHERAHAEALDPALLFAAAVAIALQPWNVGLWAMIARLKLAIESDCDRRVLGTTGDARAYGRLLVAVYQRATYGHTPYLAFVQRPSNLERRIRRMTRSPRLLSIGAAAAALAAIVLCTAAWVAPSPSRAATVRTLEHFVRPYQTESPLSTVRVVTPRETATHVDDTISISVPAVQLTSAGFTAGVPMPSVPAAPPVKILPRAPTNQISPCLFAGTMSGMGMTPRHLPPEGCTADGEIVVLTIDNPHVLVAVRDSTDIAFDGVDYVLFDTGPVALPPTLNWATLTGHLQVDNDWYIASPSPDKRAIVFVGPKGSAKRYPEANHFPVGQIEVRHDGKIKWDILRQLPTAPRCRFDQIQASNGPPSSRPVIYVDGVRLDKSGPCFIVHGKPLFLW